MSIAIGGFASTGLIFPLPDNRSMLFRVLYDGQQMVVKSLVLESQVEIAWKDLIRGYRSSPFIASGSRPLNLKAVI